MIKCVALPTAGVMAARAYRAELTIVGIFCGVARHAFLGCAFEYAVDVTGLALNARVRAGH